MSSDHCFSAHIDAIVKLFLKLYPFMLLKTLKSKFSLQMTWCTIFICVRFMFQNPISIFEQQVDIFLDAQNRVQLKVDVNLIVV